VPEFKKKKLIRTTTIGRGAKAKPTIVSKGPDKTETLVRNGETKEENTEIDLRKNRRWGKKCQNRSERQGTARKRGRREASKTHTRDLEPHYHQKKQRTLMQRTTVLRKKNRFRERNESGGKTKQQKGTPPSITNSRLTQTTSRFRGEGTTTGGHHTIAGRGPHPMKMPREKIKRVLCQLRVKEQNASLT